MYGGYGIGEPAHPALAARARRVDRHEGPDRDDPSRRVAVPVAKVHRVGEPGIVDLDPAIGRITHKQHKVLVAAKSDFSHYRPSGIELSVDDAQVGTDPA